MIDSNEQRDGMKINETLLLRVISTMLLVNSYYYLNEQV